VSCHPEHSIALPRLDRRHHHGADDHRHDHRHSHVEQGHSHGLVDATITRSRAGVKAVAFSLAVLAATAAAQAGIYVVSGSVALL
jgi:ABC-type Zn2+ transport system substrate-binding protein/surface adhesin